MEYSHFFNCHSHSGPYHDQKAPNQQTLTLLSASSNLYNLTREVSLLGLAVRIGLANTSYNSKSWNSLNAGTLLAPI